MQKFIIKSSIFILTIAILYTIWFFYLSYKFKQTDSYIREFSHKILLAESSRNTPRIILVGGSNLAFGVDSKALSDSLGIDIVNYGLHAGLGLKSPMEILTGKISDGDIIIVMPEYETFYDEAYYGGDVISEFMLLFPEEIRYMDIKSILKANKGIKRQYQLLLKSGGTDNTYTDSSTFRYSCYGFDKYGDEISHLKFDAPSDIDVHKNDGDFNTAAATDFVRILDRWTSKGAKVLVIKPCLYDKNYELNRDKINYIIDYFKNTDYKFYGEMDQSLFPKEEMFDTEYHLNTSGRDRNTLRVLNLILSNISQ